MPASDGVKQIRDSSAGRVLLASWRPDRRLLVHGGLMALTGLSTLVAGAFLQGVDPLGTRFVTVGGLPLPYPTALRPELLGSGAPFATAFLAILIAHEMGHWLAARRHGLRVSLPYFIPFPPYLSLIGTLGAFIRIRSPLRTRAELLDVGAAGPWAGFVVALPLLVVGLVRSTPVPAFGDPVTPFLIRFLGEPIGLGAGPLLHGLGTLLLPDTFGRVPVLLDPLALAGWLGLFVTALNLLPVGQLDGGHVLHALVGHRPRWPGRAVFAVLIPLGFLWWGWWLWAGIAALLSRRLPRPGAAPDEGPGLGPVRRAVGVGALALLPLTFVPVPLVA